MTAMPTAEEFLVTPYPEEPDEETPLEALPSDPLESIAASLGLLTSIIVRRDREDQEDGENKQALDQLDSEFAELQEENERLRQLLDDTLTICKPSTSKLANNIRALLEVDTVTAAAAEEPEAEEPEAEEPEAEDQLQQPAHDAPVEEWRTYARFLGHGRSGKAFDELEAMNRSQIRTALGLAQTEGGA